MFATGLIVFRESLEAVLFVGIVAASTRGIPLRGRWLAGGVAIGVFGSLLMAGAMEWIASLANGIGQDLLTAIILSLALAMLAWHCIWVSPHAKEMAREARELGVSAARGSSSLWALSLAVSMSVLREGAESVLFVGSLLSSASDSRISIVTGAAIGLAGGVLTGVLIYGGLARIKTRHLFSITNILILILAGSLASQLAKILNQAGLVSLLSDTAWNSSAILPSDSSAGVFLHALIGYEASPSMLQLAFYLGASGSIWIAARLMTARVEQKHARIH